MEYHRHRKDEKQLGHVLALMEGFNQTLRVPCQSFFMVVIFALALFLPASFYVLWSDAIVVNERLNQSAAISLYLKKDINSSAVSNLTKQLQQNPFVANIEVISPEEGMKKFVGQIDLGEVLTGFKENPLPYMVILYPRLNELSQAQIISFVDTLKTLPEVEIVKADMKWLELSKNLLTMWKQMIQLLLMLFSIGAVMIICYVAYVAAVNIIGKQQAFSVRALQYQYFWYGLIGGLVALALVNFLLMLLHNPYFVLQGLGAKKGMIFVLFNILLSTLGLKIALIKAVNSENHGAS